MPLSRARAIPIALASLLLALSSEGAEGRKKPGRYQLGPLYVTPRLTLRNAGIDTNVFQTLQDPIRDAVVVLSPRVDGVLPVGRRLRITGLGFIEEYYFHRQGDEGSTDFYGEGEAELELGPLTLLGGGGGGQFTQRFSIDVDDRLKRQEKRAHAGATWRLTRRFSMSGKASGEVVTFAPGEFRNGGDVKEAMDRNTVTATGQLRFALTNRTTLLVSGDALEDRFFSQPATLPPVRRSYRLVGGFEFAERAVVSGHLLAGVRDFPGTLDQGSPPYRGPVVDADLTLPLGGVGRVHFLGLRDVRYASSLVDIGTLRYRNAFVLTSFRGETLFDLPLGLIALTGAGYEDARYLLPYPYPTPSNLAGRRDHRWTADLGLVRQFGEQVRIGGHVSWARRVSSLPNFSYEGWRYGLTAEIVP
jgi:hypothetical protein